MTAKTSARVSQRPRQRGSDNVDDDVARIKGQLQTGLDQHATRTSTVLAAQLEQTAKTASRGLVRLLQQTDGELRGKLLARYKRRIDDVEQAENMLVKRMRGNVDDFTTKLESARQALQDIDADANRDRQEMMSAMAQLARTHKQQCAELFEHIDKDILANLSASLATSDKVTSFSTVVPMVAQLLMAMQAKHTITKQKLQSLLDL